MLYIYFELANTFSGVSGGGVQLKPKWSQILIKIENEDELDSAMEKIKSSNKRIKNLTIFGSEEHLYNGVAFDKLLNSRDIDFV